jgi:hypothetical protein
LLPSTIRKIQNGLLTKSDDEKGTFSTLIKETEKTVTVISNKSFQV